LVPEASAVSSEFAQAFSAKGLVRVFRELRALLPKSPEEAWSESVESRFTDMVRSAAQFELRMEPGMRMSDFAEYLSACSKRNLAEPGRVRIMTIHRSKGLGFDYVLLPLYEHEGLGGSPDGPLIGPNWILPNPTSVVANNLPELRLAWDEAQSRMEQEELCTYYVAMTRAKRALTIVTHPESRSTRRFSDYVRESIPEADGTPDWYVGCAPQETSLKHCNFMAPNRKPRTFVSRRLPSLTFVSGQSAGSLFAVDSRQSARSHGTVIHAAYEQVEFNDWLIKPKGCTGLWRERSFEIFDGNSWISGRFDRVVFTGEGDERAAEIGDFKTNRNFKGLSDGDFIHELKQKYAGQMATYQLALSILTGIPRSRIRKVLLLTESKSVVDMDDDN